MDAIRKLVPRLRTPSSPRVFGDWSLAPPDEDDEVPQALLCASGALREDHRELLREAHRRLLPAGRPRVLELTAGASSFVAPDTVGDLVGVAADAARLDANEALTARLVHDLNADPRLPLADGRFDAVVANLAVGRLTRPLEVFREAARVLVPGGVVAVTFGPAHFARDFTRMWALGDDREHVVLAEAFLEFADAGFVRPQTVCLYHGGQGIAWTVGGMPPELRVSYVYAVYSYRGETPAAVRARPPFPEPESPLAGIDGRPRPGPDGVPCCPYCGHAMSRYAPPTTVFEIDYGVPWLWVCFNDGCEYHRRSRPLMRARGQVGWTYRFMFDPHSGACGPIPDSLAGGLQSGRLD